VERLKPRDFVPPQVKDVVMAWHSTDSVDEFWSAAGEFLRSRPVEHILPLSLTDTLRTRNRHFYGPDDPRFGWYEAHGTVLGGYLQTPPRPLIIVGAPAEAVPELAALLADRPLPGVNASAADGEVFAEAWQRLTGAAHTVNRRTRLFRLGTLTPPPAPPAGRARVARAADRELLVAWLQAFHQDVGEPDLHPARTVDDRLTYGGLTLWEVDGHPVSLAGAHRIQFGVVSVAPVYTPPDLRGRGYAAAVTSSVTRSVLDAGADDVVLFTDLANPTSNGVYQRLGYRPVEDRVVMEFKA
jgi:RimJ/RimL family protein N-acetyltransferase